MVSLKQDEFLNGVELHPFAVHTGSCWFCELGVWRIVEAIQVEHDNAPLNTGKV